jgi:hypothetical protein
MMREITSEEAAMTANLSRGARVFAGAYAGAVTWVLAGCGWGVVIGAALEAAFGRGADGLLAATGETALEATAGALLGVVAAPLLLAALHLVTLVPAFALIGKGADRYPYGNRDLGILHERSARVGAVTAVVIGLINGTMFGPVCGAGSLLESIHGGRLPCAFVEWCTVAGVLVGGVIGLAAMAHTIYWQVPEEWRQEFRRGLRPARPQ